MPSAFTHAFTGAAISTLAPRAVRGVELGFVLAGVAALPDLDVLAFRAGVPYAHPLGHRGFSHSLLFALLAAAAVWWWMARRRRLRGSASAALFVVAFVAAASHGFLDAFTDAGLGVGFFIPFTEQRFFFPWRPVRTSPLSVAAFFTADGLRIFENEVRWVWLPVTLAILLIAVAHRVVGEPRSARP